MRKFSIFMLVVCLGLTIESIVSKDIMDLILFSVLSLTYLHDIVRKDDKV